MNTVSDKNLEASLIEYSKRVIINKGYKKIISDADPVATVINPNANEIDIRYTVTWYNSNGKTISVECIIKHPSSTLFMDMGVYIDYQPV
jgi:uncharacterized protein YcfL